MVPAAAADGTFDFDANNERRIAAKFRKRKHYDPSHRTDHGHCSANLFPDENCASFLDVQIDTISVCCFTEIARGRGFEVK
jgi:hypothetical protein